MEHLTTPGPHSQPGIGDADLARHPINGAATHQDFALEGLGHNADFLSLLRTGAVQTIHTQEATLEAIFIQVTGQSLQ